MSNDLKTEDIETVDSDPPLLVIVGPTAVGKTAAAVEIARTTGGEIVSADSMQVYRAMDIGTCKPTATEMRLARFHLVDIAEPNVQVTVSYWKSLAESAILEIRRRGRVPIVCGGTGLYIRSLLQGWMLAGTAADPELRASLSARAQEVGSAVLHKELAEIDPSSASRLHPNDLKRIVRALEVYYTSGVTITDHIKRDGNRAAVRPAMVFGLMLPRPLLYERIEARVDQMIAGGLENEVRRLLDSGIGPDLSSMRSLGYREMVQHIEGEISHPEMVSAIKQSTRRYAKRQETWFRRDSAIEWIDVTALNSTQVADRILHRLEKEHKQITVH